MLAGGMGDIGGDAIAIRELTKPAEVAWWGESSGGLPRRLFSALARDHRDPGEPITCAACRRLIPHHAESRVIRGSAYHARCRDRMESPSGPATVTFS
jgi:hypothetical protein